MPGQLLPLRFLGGSSGLLGSPRGISILSRAFPFKVKYSVLCPGQPPRPRSWGAGAARVRAFSRRSAEGRGGGREGNFRAGRAAAAGHGRSLVEDEAELSDWISGLKTDSFRVGAGSERDDAGGYDGGRTRTRERGRGRDGDRGRVGDGRSLFRSGLGSESDGAGEFTRGRASSRESGRGRDADRGKVRDGRGSFRGILGSESDDAGEFTRGRASSKGRDGDRGKVRDGRGSFRGTLGSESDVAGEFTRGRASTRERGRGRDVERGRVRDPRERGRESLPSQRGGGRFSRGERGREPEDFDSFFERRQTRDSDRPLRGSRSSHLTKMTLGSDLDEEEEDVDFGSRKRREHSGTGGMSSSSSLAKKGRKYSAMSFKISDEEETADDDEEEEESVSGSEDGFFSKVEDTGEIMVPDAYDGASLSREQEDAPSRPSSSEGAESYLTQTRFDQCSLSPLSLKGIKTAGYERMTMVQEATLPVILKGKDVLAKAKTGTGKTVAFLLPSIEVITKLPPVDRDEKRPPIYVLVICPTRELANQAAMEGKRLLKFHPSIGIQVVIGGTRLALEQKNMQANPCQILVATPGRLRDHIENTAGFATRLKGVKVLVLDEADHLLDMGFRKDIENIIAAVPKQRQTLLFSATVPDEVRQICHIALKRDHEFINTVEEGSEETHSQVEQLLLVSPLEKHFSMLYGILTDHISENLDYKVLVFCTTAMVTRLIADLLSELNLNVREIHSRKPQSYRTRVSEEFRKSKGLILVTSDVSARGVDYPDVTLVIQVGVPADREQYIHRLGRTGRKGKEGKGILLLAPWEEFFLSSIKDLPLSKAPVPLVDPDTRKKVERALSHVEMKNKEAAYQSWLGYYNSNKNVGRDKSRLVTLANEFSISMGLDNPPAIPKLVLGKMGLRNVPGLRAK